MKYDTIRIAASLNALPRKSGALVDYCLEINDQAFRPELALNIFDLAKSCQSSGELYIFVCSCGIPECAGILEGVSVDHYTDAIVWASPDPVSPEDESSEAVDHERATYQNFFFEPQQYIRAIEAGIKDIKLLAISAERPVAFPVRGVLLEEVMMLQARVFSTNHRDGEKLLSPQQIIVNGYYGRIILTTR